jgi:hypothetical protein
MEYRGCNFLYDKIQVRLRESTQMERLYYNPFRHDFLTYNRAPLCIR